MNEPKQGETPTPVQIPSSEEQLEESRSRKHKTTADEAVIKLDEDLKSGKENPI